jgi:DNA sulfur modification protein DndC
MQIQMSIWITAGRSLQVTKDMEQIRELVQAHGNNLAFVVNHSGGKDSTRMLGLVRESFADVATHVVMADTGFEHVAPISAADFARSLCKHFGLDLTVVRNQRRTYLQMVEQRGMFPSPQFRQCTSDLKRGPIDKFIRSLPYEVIVNCIGIRAEESSPRARQSPLTLNSALSTRKRMVYNWLPIFEQTLSDVLEWHWRRPVPLHPVYLPEYHKDGTTGGYLRRLSCRICIFSTDADLHAIHLHDRPAFEMISDLERRLNFTMRPGASLVQIVEARCSPHIAEIQQQSFCF